MNLYISLSRKFALSSSLSFRQFSSGNLINKSVGTNPFKEEQSVEQTRQLIHQQIVVESTKIIEMQDEGDLKHGMDESGDMFKYGLPEENHALVFRNMTALIDAEEF